MNDEPSDTPDRWEDRVSGRTAGLSSTLAGGILSQQQARAYVLGEIRRYHRAKSAERLGVEPSTYDTHLGKARRKVEQARHLLDVLTDAAVRCSGCGEPLAPLPSVGTTHHAYQRDSSVTYCDPCEEYRRAEGLRPEEHEQYRLRADQ